MRSPRFVCTFALAFAVVASANPWSPPPYNRYAPLKKGITWTPCTNESSEQCGTFEVPLDYNDLSAGKASLAVIRYQVEKEQKLGTLFTNPGGPGEGGVEYLKDGASSLAKASGHRYDIVSWDPRGVGLSSPRANCFASFREEFQFLNGSIIRSGIEVRGHFVSDEDLLHFYNQAPAVDRQLIKLGNHCMRPDVLQYIGSVATVRDMVALHDYLEGPDKPLNFWGFSYGTIIGVYFANMFPHRVGRLILDGVVDPEYWANKPPHKSYPLSIEAANISLNGFISECVQAGPTRCKFAIENDTTKGMRQRIVDLLDRTYDLYKGKVISYPSSAFVRNILFQGMYSPGKWTTTALFLKQFDTITREAEVLLTDRSPQRLTALIANTKSNSYDDDDDKTHEWPISYAFQAITCADAVDAGNVTTIDIFNEIFGTMEVVDHIFGPSFGSGGFYCHRWLIRAVERYNGPWDNTPANKILVIGNEGDPVTPLTSAKIVAGQYGGAHAVLVEQENYGHTSFSMHSNCTLAIVESYLVNNTLPKSFRKVCGTNNILFPEPKQSEEPEDPEEERIMKFGRWPNLMVALGFALALSIVYLAISRARVQSSKVHSRTWKVYKNSDMENARECDLVVVSH